MSEVVIYTDGACRGNPGPGGWGALLVSGAHRRELWGGEAHTTNNRMELMAAIESSICPINIAVSGLCTRSDNSAKNSPKAWMG